MNGGLGGIEPLIPLFLIGIFIVAPIAYWLSPKMGARRWLWLVLALIPGINLFVLPLLTLRALGAILDRMEDLKGQLDSNSN